MQQSESIVLGGGCFWCLEAVYQETKGVEAVTSGYAGGTIPYPDYEFVSSGQSGYAEVVKVNFHAKQIDLATILDIYFVSHNPTTLNRQGNDVGSQYRSLILYADARQKAEAEAARERAQKVWDDHIVTEIAPLEAFYEAEEYHQDYFQNHPEQAYCQVVIAPKLSKVRATFRHLLKRSVA